MKHNYSEKNAAVVGLGGDEVFKKKRGVPDFGRNTARAVFSRKETAGTEAHLGATTVI